MSFYLAIIAVFIYASIPFSLLLGKIYGVDIRTIGSGNIGGTNLGRACGKKAFAYAFVLDGSKGVLPVLLANQLDVNPLILFPFALIGHTFSVFINFKGGKGIATSFGFVVAMTPFYAFITILVFLLLLKFTKYVSSSSIIATIFYFFLTLGRVDYVYSSFIFAICIIVTILHRKNIIKIKNKTENKITWM